MILPLLGNAVFAIDINCSIKRDQIPLEVEGRGLFIST